MNLDQPLTLGIIVVAVIPSLIAFFKWLAGRESTRLAAESASLIARVSALELDKGEREKADIRRDRDHLDLQRSHGETRAEVAQGLQSLDTRLQKSSEAQASAMRQLQVDLRQEITRAMREVMAEKKSRVARK